jgi:hypothetical protein
MKVKFGILAAKKYENEGHLSYQNMGGRLPFCALLLMEIGCY